MKNLAHVLRFCWKAYKEASRDYFAPLLVLWNGAVNGKTRESGHHRTGHIGKA